jgi:hypothetical protein
MELARGRRAAGATGFAHSTVWRVLWRAGISRRSAAIREPANRYEWPCPGDLLHMDVSRYAHFEQPGHAVTGDRSHKAGGWMRAETRVGYDYAPGALGYQLKGADQAETLRAIRAVAR